jgi:hypothetical protein
MRHQAQKRENKMSTYTAETFKHNGYTVEIIADPDAQSPEEYGDDGIFIVTTRNRYFERLHNGEDAKGCMEDKELCKRYWIFPVYAYIHGGVALSLGRGGQFSDMWDSGQIGFVFAAKSEWRYENRTTKNCVSARKAAESHVEVWNQYLSGDVWGFEIKDANGNDVDSCWGFYGLEYCKQEAIGNVPDEPSIATEEDEAFEETLA